MTQTLNTEQPVTDWFRGDTYHPAFPGLYEVGHSEPIDLLDPTYIFGSRRYWDGIRWLAHKDGPVSVFGKNAVHQWRGVRMWVLVRKSDPIMSALAGKPVDVYLLSARPRSARFGNAQNARPFKNQNDAQRFGDRFSHLGLTAVLA